MSSVQAKILNKIFQMLPKDPPGTKHDYAAERERNAKRKPPKLPKNVVLEQVNFDGVAGEILRPADVKAEGTVIWYIHGGGFTTGSAVERREITQYLASRYHITCISTNYRLSPEHKWPAHLDDCMKVYDCLVKQGADPGQLILMGESAGGTLVLSMGLRLAMEGKRQPKAIVAFSPCTEQSQQLNSHMENVKTDYMLGDALNRSDQFEAVFGIYGREGHEQMLKNPLISPYYGNYSDLPPVFLAASDTEILYDDSRILYEKLKAEGHLVEMDVKHDVCHAYPMFPMMPEAKETIEKAMRFVLKL